MELVVLGGTDEETLRMVRELVESLGPPPIDLVVVGGDETRFEVGDVHTLKVSQRLFVSFAQHHELHGHASFKA